MQRADARSVCTAFSAALARHGVPDQLLTDNASDVVVTGDADLLALGMHGGVRIVSLADFEAMATDE